MGWDVGSSRRGIALTAEQAATLLYFKYNETTDKLVASKSIETILASVFLGDKIKMSGGGENVIFHDIPSGTNWSPSWQGVKDQSILSNQDSTGIIQLSVRKYSENLLSIEPAGIVSATNITDYSDEFVYTYNVSAYGVRFKLGQDLEIGNILRYSLYVGDAPNRVKIYEYNEVVESAYLSGDFYDFWYDHQSEFLADVKIFAEIQVETELNSGVISTLQAYATDADPTTHYVLVRLRSFEDIKSNPFTDELEAAFADVQAGLANKQIVFSKDGVLSGDAGMIYYSTPDGINKVIGIGDFDTVIPFTGTNSLSKGIHIRNEDGGLVLEEIDEFGDTVSMISLQAGVGKKFYLKNEVDNTEILSLDNSDVLRAPSCTRFEVGDDDTGGEISILGPNSMMDMAVWSIYETTYQNNGLEFAYDSGGNCMYLYNWTGGVKNPTPIMKFCRNRNSVRLSNLELLERSSNPSDPPEGEAVIWMSNGAGSGSDGDIMIKIRAGGVTKTKTIVDFSA